MSPPCVKGEDSAPGGHPEAENVPPPGTPALSNVDEAVATNRLGMSPLKTSVANEGRQAAPHHKGASPSTPATCSLRKPVLILRRLDPNEMLRTSDILQMGLNMDCAKRIRKELVRSRKNCRRRYLRKMGRLGRKVSRKKRSRWTGDETDAAVAASPSPRKSVVDAAAAGESLLFVVGSSEVT